MATLHVSDATASSQKLRTFTLDHLTERLIVREPILARFRQKVQDHNRSGATLFCGLVQPADTKRTVNGFKFSRSRTLNWEPQYARALHAFAWPNFSMATNQL